MSNRPLTCPNACGLNQATMNWYMRRVTHNPSGRGFESHPPHRILAGQVAVSGTKAGHERHTVSHPPPRTKHDQEGSIFQMPL
jgi:hypothetical protein